MTRSKWSSGNKLKKPLQGCVDFKMFLGGSSFSPAIKTANRRVLCWPRGPSCHLGAGEHQTPGTDLEGTVKGCAKWPLHPKAGPPLPKPALTVPLLGWG